MLCTAVERNRNQNIGTRVQTYITVMNVLAVLLTQYKNIRERYVYACTRKVVSLLLQP